MTETIDFVTRICSRPEIPNLYIVIPDGTAGAYWGSEYRVTLECVETRATTIHLELTEYGRATERRWRQERDVADPETETL